MSLAISVTLMSSSWMVGGGRVVVATLDVYVLPQFSELFYSFLLASPVKPVANEVLLILLEQVVRDGGRLHLRPLKQSLNV